MTLQHLFWDSCVFIRYVVGDETTAHFDDIARFVDDAKAGKFKIYFSTITFAEMRREFFVGNRYGSINDFFSDFGRSLVPIEPNPNILIAAGELRSAKSTNPGDPNPPKQRTIATPDAILLSSCLYARDALGISDIVLHSTDEGKNKGWYGRSIPIVGFERWYPEPTRTNLVKEVCSLTRTKPIHPEPVLRGILSHSGLPTSPRSASDEQPT